MVSEHLSDTRGHLPHFRFLEAAGCHSRAAEPDTARVQRWVYVEWNSILIDRDMRVIEREFRFLAAYSLRKHVNQHQVAIRSAGHDSVTLGGQAGGHHLRVCDYLLLIPFEIRRHRFQETNGLRRDDMHERSALGAREYGTVDILAVFLASKNHP